MFQKILAALDRTSAGMQVFQHALALAKDNHSQLMLLHVLCPDDQGYPDFPAVPGIDTYYSAPQSEEAIKSYLTWWQDYERQGIDWLRSLTTEASNVGVPTEFTQQQGLPGRTICDLARSWQADLVLVGRRGRSGLSELLLGSVSNYVIHHAPCSVLVLQSLAQEAPEQPL